MKKTVVFLCLFYSGFACAYETDTHAMITLKAFERSTLHVGELQRRLGLERFPNDDKESRPFQAPSMPSYGGLTNAYYDTNAAGWSGNFSAIERRGVLPYEREKMYSLPTEDYKDSANEHRIKAWLMRGAIREDDLSPDSYAKLPVPDADPHGDLTRVFHHFFNPLSNAGLQLGIPCSVLPYNIDKCSPSADWAFGTIGITGQNVIKETDRRNHFSWADAREALWCALTRNAGDPNAAPFAGDNAAERRLCWATTIHSLGHVIHLLQDTGQPQHVRNDPHNPYPESEALQFVGTTLDRRMYEVWTNFRLTEGVSLDDVDEIAQFRTFFKNSGATRTPIHPGLNYPIPRFSEPQYYFTTRQVETATTPDSLKKRRGLADLTNRSLFSEGTILDSDFPLPPPDPTSPDYTTLDRFIKHFQEYGDLIERHLAIPLTDPLKGAYTDTPLAAYGGQLPLATVSMWKEYGWAGAGVIGLDEYSTHADVLIPRAIAYSAGLIDYFFRGKLEITPPLDGLFSVIDHGTPHTVNAKGYPIRSDDSKVFGFTKLRLRVRNATDVVNESGTNLPIPRDVMSTSASAVPLQGDPTLVAVARYHRNPCYKPDLSGERRIAFDGVVTEPAGCGADGTRTPFQELSVSKPAISSAAAMNGTGQDIVFDFGNQPIPVNATDLALQVVYRGPLGLESDAIAVGSFDVREPTYLTHWNNSDYAGCGGGWYPNGATPPGCIVEGFGAKRAIPTTRLCIGTQMVFEHLENAHGSLGTGDFVRLVALLDDAPKATRSRSVVHHLSNAEIRNRGIAGHLRQSDKEQATAAAPFVSEPFFSKRGLVGSLRPLPYYQINGTDPQPANDAGALDVGALATPLEVAMAPSPGNIKFPDVGESSMACTTSSNKAVFADELAHAAGSKTSSWH